MDQSPERDLEESRMVEQELFRRCVGYDVTEVKTEITDKGEKTVTTTKHIPGDVSAQLTWLKNRRPDRWRDKPDAVGPAIQVEAHRALVEALRGNAEGGKHQG